MAASYNNLAETRDVQIALGSDTAAIQRTLSDGFTNIATNFCSTQRAIDGIKYEGAINTAAINSNIDSKFAAFEKAQSIAKKIGYKELVYPTFKEDFIVRL